VSISMHQSSVGVFSHFLDSLSDLLDRAAAHAGTRKIDPSILLSARLFPNMYNLTRQVGEANRHAVLACALLAGIDPPVFPETEPDIAELKARIAVAKKFMGNIPPAQNRWHGRKGSRLHIQKWLDAKIYRPMAAAELQRAAVLFPRHDSLRHCGVELVKKDFLGKPPIQL
jgi:uncharacterized protein